MTTGQYLDALAVRYDTEEAELRSRRRRRDDADRERRRRRRELRALALVNMLAGACLYLAAGGSAFPH